MSRAKMIHVNGQKILNELAKKGITQKDFAEKILNRNYIHVHRYIHRGEMTEALLEDVSKALGVSRSYLEDKMGEWFSEDTKMPYIFDEHTKLCLNGWIDKPVKDLLIASWINPEDLSEEQFKEIKLKYFRLGLKIREELREN